VVRSAGARAVLRSLFRHLDAAPVHQDTPALRRVLTDAVYEREQLGVRSTDDAVARHAAEHAAKIFGEPLVVQRRVPVHALTTETLAALGLNQLVDHSRRCAVFAPSCCVGVGDLQRLRARGAFRTSRASTPPATACATFRLLELAVGHDVASDHPALTTAPSTSAPALHRASPGLRSRATSRPRSRGAPPRRTRPARALRS